MQAELGAKRENITQNDDALIEVDIGDDDNDIRSISYMQWYLIGKFANRLKF